MKIGIIGAGSIGLLLASYLSNTFSITLYTRTTEQAKEINDHGLHLIKGTEQFKFDIFALPINKWTGSEDLTIIAVKQYQLDSLLRNLDGANSHQALLFLQNGMGHLELLTKLQPENIYVGSIEHGAQKVNANTVRHNGEGKINVAVFRGEATKLVDFAKKVPETFPFIIKDDYYKILVNKLIINAVINPLTAILQVKNGELVDNPFYYTALRNLFTEIAYILNIDQAENLQKQLMDICKKTANNYSSMLKDVEAKRKTEVDAILGFLLTEAKKQEKEAPLVESYYSLIKGKEENWRDSV
ncbi:MAG: 2-dehydropantoate 2-reductase [Neobacillus sp.]|jgi:2-dehydropantoate 2-reductase|nr:2-dehydropantoate 2-reductase [Neobacillus sp.]